MQNVLVQLMSLRFLCAIEKDEIKRISPQHPLLAFENKDLSEEEQKIMRKRLYTTYGPMHMNREDPSVGDQILCFQEYLLALKTALVIEKVKNWGKLS